MAKKQTAAAKRERNLRRLEALGMGDLVARVREGDARERELRNRKQRERRSDLAGMTALTAAAVRAFRPAQCPTCEHFDHLPWGGSPVFCVIRDYARTNESPRVRALVWSTRKPCELYLERKPAGKAEPSEVTP